MDDVRLIDANHLEKKMLRYAHHTCHETTSTAESCAEMVRSAPTIDPETFPPRWPKWIRTAERKPTAEDANEDGCVLSINMNRGDTNTTNWPWNVVAAFPDCFPVWMPLPKKPDLKKER